MLNRQTTVGMQEIKKKHPQKQTKKQCAFKIKTLLEKYPL